MKEYVRFCFQQWGHIFCVDAHRQPLCDQVTCGLILISLPWSFTFQFTTTFKDPILLIGSLLMLGNRVLRRWLVQRLVESIILLRLFVFAVHCVHESSSRRSHESLYFILSESSTVASQSSAFSATGPTTGKLPYIHLQTLRSVITKEGFLSSQEDTRLCNLVRWILDAQATLKGTP